MKVKKPIKVENIPNPINGKARDPKFDELARKVQELPLGQSLPIECETKSEAASIRLCLLRRLPNAIVTQRGLIIYVHLV